MATEQEVLLRYESLRGVMDERVTRWWAGAEALAIGRGGIALVSRATGISRTTVRTGRAEVLGEGDGQLVKIRRKGAGRPRIEKVQPGLLGALEGLVDPVTRGDPESPLRWTTKSTRVISAELGKQGFIISQQKVGQLLGELGYSLQAVSKTLEGESHPDRNAQFEHINAEAQAYQARGQPVVSVDTKKKELVGEFKNAGREWCCRSSWLMEFRSVSMMPITETDPGVPLREGNRLWRGMCLVTPVHRRSAPAHLRPAGRRAGGLMGKDKAPDLARAGARATAG
jgi:hypothetical protein